jgi:hypothetical protein
MDPAFKSPFNGSFPCRLKQRFAWSAPAIARRTGNLCRAVGELSDLTFFLRQWRDLSFAVDYWGQIKAKGLDWRDVKELAQ